MKSNHLSLAVLALLAAAPFAFAQGSHSSMPCCAPPSAHGAAAQQSGTAKTDAKSGVQKATVTIDGGYSPASLSVKAGKPVEITFIRKSKGGCDGDVVFPGLNIKRTIKPGETIVVKFTPKTSGTIAYTCGMGMYKGQVVAQ